MKRSYLIQRLEAPVQGRFLGMKDNPFAFGGGLRNGGLSGDAMDVLRPIFQFAYMGAAEYEWGAVPEALNKVRETAVAGDLCADTLAVPFAGIKPSWRAPKGFKAPAGDATVFILCGRSDIDEVRDRVSHWAREDATKGEYEVRDWTGLSRSLMPFEEYDERVKGWLELDNGFMFFTSEDMWSATAAAFGVEAARETTTPTRALTTEAGL